MPEVMFMCHHGAVCALPSRQVLRVRAALPVNQPESVSLWGTANAAEPEPRDRWLEVVTAFGPRWLRCSEVQPGQLVRDAVWELPRLLRDVLGLAHVVGLAEREGELVWLLDLRRLSLRGESMDRVNQCCA